MSQSLRSLVLAVALLVAPTAHAASRGDARIVVRMPAVAVPPGASVEACWFVRLPRTTPFDLGAWHVRQRGVGGSVSSQHALVYQYVGASLDAFAASAEGRVIQSRGCLDVGPDDRDARLLVAGGRSDAGFLPTGLALPLAPTSGTPGGAPAGVGLLVDANWVNGSTRTRKVRLQVVLERAKPGTIRRRLTGFQDRSAEAGIAVAPFAVGATEPLVTARWQPPRDVCLLGVTGQMHRRGLWIGVDRLDATGAVANPSPGVKNPFVDGRTQLFGSPDYTDAGTRDFPRGLLLRTTEALATGCWHDGGVNVPVRLGCEESPGVVPGSVGAPARPCTQTGPAVAACLADDPRWAGRTFTGACVPATLVAGSDPDDEACILSGFHYDAVPGAADADACDVSQLPVLD